MKKFLNYETLITPMLLKVLYPTMVVIYLVKYFWKMVSAFFSFSLPGLGASFTALAYFLVMPFALRIVFEFFYVLFRMYEHTHKLANPDTELSGVIYSMDQLKSEANKAKQEARQQAQNFQYGQQPSYHPNQPYNPAHSGQQPQYGQPQAGFNPQVQPGFGGQPQQAPNFQGQPQSFPAQPNPVTPATPSAPASQPTQPSIDAPVNSNTPQQ